MITIKIKSNLFTTAEESLEESISNLKEHLDTMENIVHIKDNTATILAVEVTNNMWVYDTVKNKYKYTITPDDLEFLQNFYYDTSNKICLGVAMIQDENGNTYEPSYVIDGDNVEVYSDTNITMIFNLIY